MGLSYTVSEIDGDFSWKLQKKIPTPLYFVSLLNLELGIGTGVKKTRMMGLLPKKKYDYILSRLDTIHQRDGQRDRWTDGQTDTGRQQRPRLRIASRGKK